MSTNGINEAFNAGFKVKLQNRGAKSSGITWELKSVFDDMAKQGLIKDTDGKGLSKQDALNLYAKLNEMHKETNRATNYTRMQVGQEFDYTADEMKALAQAAGYEIVGQETSVKISESPEAPKPQENGKVVQEQHNELETGPSEGENPVYDNAVKEGYKSEKTSIEDLEQQIKDNKAENKELRKEIQAQRKEARIERREERRAERAENREARQNARADRQQARELEKAKADFSANGQIGKIVNGKYYINGTEVSKDVYEVAKNKVNANETVKEKTMSDEQLAEYLSNDMNYQKHKNNMTKMDNIMKEIETKHNFERGNFSDETDMHFANREDGDRYSEAKWNYRLYSSALPKYEKEMSEWKDGPCGKDSFYREGLTRWTNLERITLSSGQKAWKTDQGTFYPGPNGMPGFDKVPDEEL